MNGKRSRKKWYLLTTSGKPMLNQPFLWIPWLKHYSEYLWTGRECHPALCGTFHISATSYLVWENRCVTTNIILKSFLNWDFRFPPSRIQVICDVSLGQCLTTFGGNVVPSQNPPTLITKALHSFKMLGH